MKQILIAFVITFSSLFSFAAAQLPEKKISMAMKGMGAKDMLQAMLISSGLKYNIAPDINNDQKVELIAKDIKWSDAFKKVLEQAHLTYSFDSSDVLQITKAKK